MTIPYRKEKLAAQIQRDLSDIIRREIQDPRVGFATVTRVTVSPDYKYAKVFLSVMGTPKQKKLSLEAFKHARGFLQRELSKRLKLRQVPELSFVRDEALDKAFKVTKIISDLTKERRAGGEEE